MGGSLSSVVERFNLKSRIWTTLTELQVARNEASSCNHGDYLYIFGGLIGTDDNFDEIRTDSIERLNLSHL